jgi:hypothetical protein
MKLKLTHTLEQDALFFFINQPSPPAISMPTGVLGSGTDWAWEGINSAPDSLTA